MNKNINGVKDYYGSKTTNSISYLEFGQIDLDKAQKTVYSFKLHQKAYDWFMLARYTNDILTLRNMQKYLLLDKLNEVCDLFLEVHHSNELCLGLGKLACLVAVSNHSSKNSFFEIGSTLFGCIDSMKVCSSFLKGGGIVDNINLFDVTYIGLDISDMFNELAQIYYNDYRIMVSKHIEKLPKKYNVFYSKGVTLLYAIRSLDELFTYINNSKVAYFDYAFSLGNDKDLIIGTGKTGRYFSFKSFLNRKSEIKNKQIYINTFSQKTESDKEKIRLEFFIGDNKYTSRFLESEKKIYNILNSKKLKDDIFLKEYHNSWVKFENFLQSIQP